MCMSKYICYMWALHQMVCTSESYDQKVDVLFNSNEMSSHFYKDYNVKPPNHVLQLMMPGLNVLMKLYILSFINCKSV